MPLTQAIMIANIQNQRIEIYFPKN